MQFDAQTLLLVFAGLKLLRKHLFRLSDLNLPCSLIAKRQFLDAIGLFDRVKQLLKDHDVDPWAYDCLTGVEPEQMPPVVNPDLMITVTPLNDVKSLRMIACGLQLLHAELYCVADVAFHPMLRAVLTDEWRIKQALHSLYTDSAITVAHAHEDRVKQLTKCVEDEESVLYEYMKSTLDRPVPWTQMLE